MDGGKTAHNDTFAADNLPEKALWPEIRLELPDLRYPVDLNCAQVLIRDAIDEGYGEKAAILTDKYQWSYRDLDEHSSRFANLLVQKLGLKPGNRVLLRSPNNPMLAAAWLGVMKAGGIAVTTMPMLRAKELATIARKAQVSHALYDPRFAQELEAAAELSGLIQCRSSFDELAGMNPEFEIVDTAADDVALLAFTSGTTGEPKATMHFHRDVLIMANVVGDKLLATSGTDIYVGSAPLGFTFGLGASLVFPLQARAALVLLEVPTPDAIMTAVETHGVTGIFTAPTMYRALMPVLEKYNHASLRICVSAGETLLKPTSDTWFEKTGMRLIDGIGATELIHIFISATGDEVRPGATGKPLHGYEACVLNDNDEPMSIGIGRLAVKGPTGCRYLNDERQREYVVNGWNVTGDIYKIDSDGYFWFQARADDMILSSGYNIAGPEVESALLAHELVLECAVIGVPDAERGNLVKAFVVLQEATAPTPELCKLLQDFVKSTVAPYKYPRLIEFVKDIPKTQTGKVQRYKLREPTD